jgi:Inner membrane component of T3SS, cytoplasmic domain/zinc-ribbon domain
VTQDCTWAERSAIVAPFFSEVPVLIIECTSCHARYQYDEERFERKPSKKIKCAKCGSVFEIQNPAFAPRPAPSSDSTSARHDETRSSRAPEPQETTAQAPLPEPAPGPAASLLQLPTGRRISIAIIAGDDAGTVYRVERPRITIGRSGADLAISDSEASRQHASIEVRDAVIVLEDLKSTNGTLVDGEKITAPIELQDKSEFQIGTTTLMLIVTDNG